MALPTLPPLLQPALILSLGIYHFLKTSLHALLTLSFPTLTSLSALRSHAFASLWQAHGAAMSIDLPPPLDPLLRSCSGTVLDIGPGSGEMLARFDASRIQKLVGVEPVGELHRGLVRNAGRAGFRVVDDGDGDGQEGEGEGERGRERVKPTFLPLECGAEPESLIPALHKSGVLSDETTPFDTISTIRVLCGVPRPQETLRNLYALLRPGGRLVVYEHVVNPWRTEGSVLARVMQFVYTTCGWPFFMGGCELQRHTERWVADAGEWESVRLEYVNVRNAVPYLLGELVKKA